MSDQPTATQLPPSVGWLARWNAIPLYLRILIACAAGAAVGLALRQFAESLNLKAWAAWLAVPSRIIVRHLLTALAAPLVLVAVVQALMQAQIPKGNGVKLICLLFLNTTVAIFIGLAVANTIKPGKWTTSLVGDNEEKRE